MKPAPVKEIDGRPRAGAVRRFHHHRPHLARPATSRPTAPGGVYLSEHQVAQKDFNSYGSRRGNYEVMERGTFANIRIRNEMMGGKEGGNTIYYADPHGRGRGDVDLRRGPALQDRPASTRS